MAGSGALETLPGRVAAVAPAFAWEKAVALTPRPFEARTRLKAILLKTLKSELRAEQGRVDPEQAERIKTALPDDVESHIYFPNRIRAAGRSFRFTVPDSFLGGPALATWGYVVVVTGADIDLRFGTSAIAGGVTRKVHDNLICTASGRLEVAWQAEEEALCERRAGGAKSSPWDTRGAVSLEKIWSRRPCRLYVLPDPSKRWTSNKRRTAPPSLKPYRFRRNINWTKVRYHTTIQQLILAYRGPMRPTPHRWIYMPTQ